MKQFLTSILRNETIAKNYYELAISWSEELPGPIPGQFLELRASEGSVPLLRRPFAFSGFDPVEASASIIYEVRGQGTRYLASRRAGDAIDVIAPLGNSFLDFGQSAADADSSGSQEKIASRQNVLVSGGVGLGPILFLARQLAGAGEGFLFIHGVREAAFIPQTQSLMGLSPVFCTDDGSFGFHGTTMDYVAALFSELRLPALFYACGPLPMLRECHNLCEEHALDCYVSMEQIMGCGFGACMGCVIKTKSGEGFARVCEEGPVFPSREVAWT